MKKPIDEMERNINLKAQSFAYMVAKILLSIWALYESYVTLTDGGRLNIIPILIFTIMNASEGFYGLVLKRKMITGDEEYKEPNKVVRTAIVVVTLAVILISVGTFIFVNIN